MDSSFLRLRSWLCRNFRDGKPSSSCRAGSIEDLSHTKYSFIELEAVKRSGSLWLYGFAEDPIVLSRKEAGGSDSGRHGMSRTRAEEEILLHLEASTF